jgi:hypothetical protein
LGSATANTGGGYLEAPILPSTGTYTILIDPNSTYTGNITFTLYDASDLTGTITINGPPVIVNIPTPGQNAKLMFTGNAGQQVSVGLSAVSVGTSSCCGSRVSISKPDGSTLLAAFDVGTSGNGSNTVTLPVSGTYSIYVDPNGANAGSMTVTLSEDLAVPITINGSPVTLNLSRAGQNAKLTFDGTAGQRVSAGMSNVSVGTSSCCGSKVSVYNPDGSTLMGALDVGTSGNGTNTLTLPTTGSYVIVIDPNGANTGNMTVTLSEELMAPISIGGAAVTLDLSRSGRNARLPFDGTRGQQVSVGLSVVRGGTSS